MAGTVAVAGIVVGVGTVVVVRIVVGVGTEIEACIEAQIDIEIVVYIGTLEVGSLVGCIVVVVGTVVVELLEVLLE